jgi:S1-C subfamily serine protease
MLRSLALVLSGALAGGAWAANPPTAPAEGASAPAVSLSARKVYEQARSQLLQIRTVLKGRASQTSVGSGFIVSKEGHIVTNFHVVSEVALEPSTHDLVYVTADGREAPVSILVLDVLHDLALLKIAPAKDAPPPHEALVFRPPQQTLAQGERMYSLGNPLDVGFAVIEGNYNGLVERSFYPQIFFSGSLSGGMSGGPALDQEGRVIGVNVARRVDGEQVSFLVPGAFAAALLERGR